MEFPGSKLGCPLKHGQLLCFAFTHQNVINRDLLLIKFTLFQFGHEIKSYQQILTVKMIVDKIYIGDMHVFMLPGNHFSLGELFLYTYK